MAIYINICHRKPLISWLLNDETRTSLTREDFSIKLGSGCKQTAAPQSDAGLHHDGKKNIISHYNGQGPLYVWVIISAATAPSYLKMSTKPGPLSGNAEWYQSQWSSTQLSVLALIFQKSLLFRCGLLSTNNDRHVTRSRPMRITHSRLLYWAV